MLDNIVEHGKKYLERYPNIKSLVVGLSGGIDSTLTAVIAREICRQTGKHKLIGVSIPIESNKDSEIQSARFAGKAFCDEFVQVKSINVLFKLYALYTKLFHGPTFKKPAEKIRRGNIKARLRMIYLYDKAHRNEGVVLSTDNLSELNLGFWTLHGDVGDLGLIQSLWKTEVYGLANYIYNKDNNSTIDGAMWPMLTHEKRALLKAIKAVPTDGLGVSTSDLDQLGVDSYREVDDVLIAYFNGDSTLKDHPIVQRHIKYAFKRDNPHNIPREAVLPGPKPVNL